MGIKESVQEDVLAAVNAELERRAKAEKRRNLIIAGVAFAIILGLIIVYINMAG